MCLQKNYNFIYMYIYIKYLIIIDTMCVERIKLNRKILYRFIIFEIVIELLITEDR